MRVLYFSICVFCSMYISDLHMQLFTFNSKESKKRSRREVCILFSGIISVPVPQSLHYLGNIVTKWKDSATAALSSECNQTHHLKLH